VFHLILLKILSAHGYVVAYDKKVKYNLIVSYEEVVVMENTSCAVPGTALKKSGFYIYAVKNVKCYG